MTATALLLLLLADAPAPAASADGLLVFGTKSEEAKAAAREAMSLTVAIPSADLQKFHAAAQRAVDADHDFALGHYLLSEAFRAEQDKEPADVQAARAQELAPQAPDGERRLIEAAFMRPPEEAIAAWQRLAADYPKEMFIQHKVAGARWSRLAIPTIDAKVAEEDLAAVRRALDALTAGGAPVAAAKMRWLLGQALERRRDFGAARREYEAADQAGRPSWNEITLTYLLEGNRAETLTRVRQEIEKNRARFGVARWNYLGHVMLEAGDPAGAMGCYESGLAVVTAGTMADNDKQVWIGRAHHGRGRCLSRLGRREEAWAEVETVRKMIDAGGEEGKQYLPAWHYLAGYVKLEAEEPEAALDHLAQAGPQHDPHRTFLMARAEERLGRKDEARKHYQEVVDSRRMGPDVAAAYDEARKRLEALSAPAEAKR